MMFRGNLVTAICLGALIAGASAVHLTKRAATFSGMYSRDYVQYFPEGPETQLPLARQAIADYKAGLAQLNDQVPPPAR